MNTSHVLQAWGKILKGQAPSLSIEITKECPLRCPGCYAYGDEHLGPDGNLRSLTDLKGQALIDGVLAIVDRERPLHLSIVGGDPLVRYRELAMMVPQILEQGTHVQVVTSAFREMPRGWDALPHLNTVVSIDGLPPEHDARRAPATYERILKNIAHAKVTVHCTITGQMMQRPGYLDEFVRFWATRPEVRKIWFSMFTPQVGDDLPEILTPAQRRGAIADLFRLRTQFSKLDMPRPLLAQFLRPPTSPDQCVFAQTTRTISADLTTPVTPCQFGGTPDCSQCGCIASMVLAAVADHKLAGILPVSALFRASLKIGRLRTPPPSSNGPRKLISITTSAGR